MATIDVALTFTQYKTLDENGNVVPTDDATFYTTEDLSAVEAGTNCTVALNSGNYILAFFYDSNGNAVEGDVEVNTPDWSYQAGFSASFTVPTGASYIRVLATNSSQVTGTLSKESADTPIISESLVFTQYKDISNGDGSVIDTSDNTFYTTVDKTSVTPNSSCTITLNSGRYILVCFYDSNGNVVDGGIETNTPDWSDQTGFSTTFTVPANASHIRVLATSNSQVTGTLSKESADTPSAPGSDLLDSAGAYLVDDFTGTSLDSSKWSYELGYVRNNELQNYTNTNDVVSDGLIALRGLKDGSGNWTSSSIISVNKFTFMYGRIEARIKVDISSGSFGAFWTLGDCFEFQYVENDKPGYLAPLYPDSGEFDVMEYYNGKLTCGIYLDDGTEVGRVWYTDYNANEWHTYAMEWHEDGSMKLYIDDHLISSTSASNNSALHIPHYILLNQAIGAAGGTPDSNDTEITQYVDWVKYYPLSTDNLSLYSTDFNLYLASQYDEEHGALVRVTYNDNCINKVLNWSSSNPALLSVHNGYVTTYPGTNGSAVITATSNTGVSRSITLYVSNGIIRDTDTPIISESLVFTQYKNISEGDGSVIDTSDNTFYTTVDKTSVTPNSSCTITLNSGRYILVCFYDSNGNVLEGYVETNTPDWSDQTGFSTTFTVPANASHIRVLATSNSQVTGTLTKEGTTPIVPATDNNTQVLIYNKGELLTPVNTTPTTGQYKVDIVSTSNCTAQVESDFKTITLLTATSNSGEINLSINIEGKKVVPKTISVASITSSKVISSHYSEQQQLADKFSWLVSDGTSSSNMQLTADAYNVISKNINLTADHINLNGYVSNDDANWSIDNEGNMKAENLKIEGETGTDILSVNYIDNPRYPATLAGSVDLYINSSSGDDDYTIDDILQSYDEAEEQGNNSLKKKFKTIQGAIDAIPKFLNNKTVHITMETNSTEDVYIRGITSGAIRLYMNGKTLYGTLRSYVSAASITVYGGTKDSPEGKTGIIHPSTGISFAGRAVSVGFEACQYAALYNLKVYAPDTIPSGISSTDKVCIGSQSGTGSVYCKNIQIVNTVVGFRANNHGSIHVNSSSGVASKYGFQATTGGIISIGNNNQAGGKIEATNKSVGGQVWYDANGPTFAAGDQTTDSGSAPVVSTTKTITIKSSYGDTYRSSVYNSWKKDGTARQGDYGYGDCTGCWFFGTAFSELKGKTISKVQITIARQRGGSYSAVGLAVKAHNYSARPSGAPTLGTSCGTLSLATGSTGTLTITNSDVLNGISNGTVKGFGIRTTYDAAHYAVCSGSVTVKITYTE